MVYQYIYYIGHLGIWRLLLHTDLLGQQSAGGGGVLVLGPAGDAHHVPVGRPALPHQLVITACCEESSCLLRVDQAGRKAIRNLVPGQGHLLEIWIFWMSFLLPRL